MDDMKECPSCCEKINAKAIKCPRCQAWQSKWRFDQSNLKHQFIFVTLLLGGMAAAYSGFVSSMFGAGNFEESKELIKIKNSSINYFVNECGARISVIGTIHNDSETTWKDIYFEVQFYNNENELIDTISENEYDLVLLSKDTTTFKITGAADKKKSSYDSHEVIIKSAREGGGLF
jgi:hypothetical protein